MNILKQINVYGDNLEVFDAMKPIGSVYVQYPGQKSPNELWENTTWEIVKYSSVSFRANGGLADSFERTLTISSRSGTRLTFTSTHNLIVGSILYDFTNNEGRIVSSVTNNNTVVINRTFTSTTVTQLLASQKDTIRRHSHTMNHHHEASSSTSISDYWLEAEVRRGSWCASCSTKCFDWLGANQCPSKGTTSDYIFINHDYWITTSTTITEHQGNTDSKGSTDTHPYRFPKIIWKRIS